MHELFAALSPIVLSCLIAPTAFAIDDDDSDLVCDHVEVFSDICGEELGRPGARVALRHPRCPE